jgi:hypothetical protein
MSPLWETHLRKENTLVKLNIQRGVSKRDSSLILNKLSDFLITLNNS